MIMDEPGRGAYPIVSPTFNDRRFKFAWSETTLRELEGRIMRKCSSIAELAAAMKVDEQVLAATIAEWNAACDRGEDTVHGRAPDFHAEDRNTSLLLRASMADLLQYPWRPGARCGAARAQRVRRADSRACSPPASSAGYSAISTCPGGNLAECFVGGWTAGATPRGSRRGRPSLRSLPVREWPRPSTDMTHPPAPAPRNNRRSVDASVLRLEDPELLRGRARFVDDVKLPGTLSAAFVRSPFAHAMFRNIDTSVARTMPGVHAIYTLEDLRPHFELGFGRLWQSVRQLVGF